MLQTILKMFESTQFLKFKLRLAKYGLQATSSPLLVFVNKVLLDLGILSNLCIVCGCFLTTKAELVVVTKTIWTAKPKIFTIWPF